MHSIAILERGGRAPILPRVNFPIRVLGLLCGISSCAPVAAGSGGTLASRATPEQRGVPTEDLDRSVDPCVDFDAYANGGWRAAHSIPEGAPRWNRRTASREVNRRQLTSLLTEVAARGDWPRGSIEALVSDHVASCLDEASLDAAGVTPLRPWLTELDGVVTRADLQRAIQSLQALQIATPFSATGGLDLHDPSRFIVTIGPGTLGLGSRDAYLKTEPAFVEMRERYRAHVATLLALGGVPAAEAGAGADGLIALERRLAEASLDAAAAADPAATDHPMRFKELVELTPHFDWKAFFDDAKLPRGDLNVAEPKFLLQLDRELTQTPVAVWVAALRFGLLQSAAPSLSKPFVEAMNAFHERVLGERPVTIARAQRCAEAAEALLPDPVGQLYVQRFFPQAAQAKADAIAQAVLAVWRDEVQAITWMTPETKARALTKLSGYEARLGAPRRWRDFSALASQRGSSWANVEAARRFAVEDNRRRVGQPTDRDRWELPASSPEAYLELQLNFIVLPAGFLQPPALSLTATDAVNFGGLGVALAHDFTHVIDLLGAENDERGRPINWWTEADRQAFTQRGQCVVDQYEGYFIEPGVHLQGKRVLGEAIGDQEGVRLALTALERSMAKSPVPARDGFTPVQQFFLSLAHHRGGAERLETQRSMVTGDPHPPAKFRVNGPVSTSPDFARAFGCRAGAPMVRAPCAVW